MNSRYALLHYLVSTGHRYHDIVDGKNPKHGEAGWWILKDWAYITGNNCVQIQIEQIICYIRSEQLDFRPPATALLPLVDQWDNFDAGTCKRFRSVRQIIS